MNRMFARTLPEATRALGAASAQTGCTAVNVLPVQVAATGSIAESLNSVKEQYARNAEHPLARQEDLERTARNAQSRLFGAQINVVPFDAVLPLLNDFARVPVCGLVSGYNMSELPPGPDRTPTLMRAVLTKRLTLRGFIVWDFSELHGAFLRDVGGWLKAGRVQAREDVVEGLENAPAAFIGMLKGANFGKLVVKVS